MTEYILHMDWGHGQEKLSFRNRETILNYLHSGFVPSDCKLEVEHNGERHEWDRTALYAKNYIHKDRTHEFNRVIKAQGELERQRKAWIAMKPKAEA
jgi:hypothetical protein